jgi:hypothetical protein
MVAPAGIEPATIGSIDAMPPHDDLEFFYQNLGLIKRELEIEFGVLDDEGQNGDDEDGAGVN